MTTSKLNVTHDLFSGEQIGDVIVLSFNSKPMSMAADLCCKGQLHDYLDLVADCDDVKVVLIKEPPTKMNRVEFVAFYNELLESGFNQISLKRMYHAWDQSIIKLVGLNKMVVYADSGNVTTPYLSIGLACDYRIVADNTVFQNPNLDLGRIPKGGLVFFLSRMLGSAAASKILLSSDDIEAEHALQRGMVDRVVPLKDLDSAALETAQSFAKMLSGYTIGIKKLLNYDISELEIFLQYEHKLLRATRAV